MAGGEQGKQLPFQGLRERWDRERGRERTTERERERERESERERERGRHGRERRKDFAHFGINCSYNSNGASAMRALGTGYLYS